MDADDNRDLERMLALYCDACAAAGGEPLPDDEARELALRLHDLHSLGPPAVLRTA
jgi:hypothetical protein